MTAGRVVRPGTRVLVTGGSSGIGAATVAAFTDRGCHVVAVGRDTGSLAELARRTGATTCAIDLTAPDGTDRVLAAAGEVDVLVAAAGAGWAGRFPGMTAAQVDTLVRINVLAPIHLSRAVLPDMLRRAGGHLVFVSSIAGHMAVADEAVYSATKAAVNAFAASVRHEAAPYGIGVSVVAPGAVDTAFFQWRGTPYPRRYPRAVSPDTVARRILHAVERGHSEVFVPRWLRFPARLRGAAPRLTDALQRRFG